MDVCPTCGLVLRGAAVCRRCRTDLTLALGAAAEAERLAAAAGAALGAGRVREARELARASLRQRRTREGFRVLAVSALLERRFSLAERAWQAWRPSGEATAPPAPPPGAGEPAAGAAG